MIKHVVAKTACASWTRYSRPLIDTRKTTMGSRRGVATNWHWSAGMLWKRYWVGRTWISSYGSTFEQLSLGISRREDVPRRGYLLAVVSFPQVSGSRNLAQHDCLTRLRGFLRPITSPSTNPEILHFEPQYAKPPYMLIPRTMNGPPDSIYVVQLEHLMYNIGLTIPDRLRKEYLLRSFS